MAYASTTWPPSGRLLAAVLFAVLLLPVPDSAAQQVDCSEELTQAQNSYDRGRFDDAITRIERCIDTTIWNDEERRRAYRLMGLSYLGKDLEGDARTTIAKLLELVPNYEPNPAEDPPAFVRMVEELQLTRQQAEEQPAEDQPSVVERPVVEEPQADRPPPPIVVQEPPRQRSGIGRWLLIGGGVVGAGVLAAVLLGGGGGGGEDGPGQIPGPPALPN